MYRLSERSLNKLADVHGDLQRVVKRAIQLTAIDFCVTEGMRTQERQRTLYDRGATRTLHSRHLTGHAVDLAAYVGGEIRWDWPLYRQIAKAMRMAAKELNIALVWGGDWQSFPDGPHFELDRHSYPD